MKKVAGSTTIYVFSGTKVIAEYAAGADPASPAKEYIYSGSQLLATEEGGATKYHHSDHLSIRLNTDGAGTVVGERGHYSFGESWYSSGVGDKWQFTTYERDAESGLDYALFRFDSSRLGRFMTPDPVAGSILNPPSLNRYAYTRNDPVNLIDPLGLFAWPPVESFMNYYSGETDPWHLGGGGPWFWGLMFPGGFLSGDPEPPEPEPPPEPTCEHRYDQCSQDGEDTRRKCRRDLALLAIGGGVAAGVVAGKLSAGLAVVHPSIPLVIGALAGGYAAWELWKFGQASCETGYGLEMSKCNFDFDLCKAGIPEKK